MNIDEWDESLGAAIESAAGSLPEKYLLQLTIEKGGYSVRLILPDGTLADIDGESIVDEIESLVVMAIKHSQQPKPLTAEQIYFQRFGY